MAPLAVDLGLYPVGRAAAAVDDPTDPNVATLLAGFAEYNAAGNVGRLRRYRTHLGSLIATATPISDGTTNAVEATIGAASSGSQVVLAWRQGGLDSLQAFDPLSGNASGGRAAIGAGAFWYDGTPRRSKIIGTSSHDVGASIASSQPSA